MEFVYEFDLHKNRRDFCFRGSLPSINIIKHKPPIPKQKISIPLSVDKFLKIPINEKKDSVSPEKKNNVSPIENPLPNKQPDNK